LLFVVGIKDLHWLALSFLLVWFFYAAGLFIYTFFSPKALKLRKSGHKKNELNLKELLVSPTTNYFSSTTHSIISDRNAHRRLTRNLIFLSM